MQIDLYTKAVLTVIAVSLAVLAVRGGIEPARALGDGCGDSRLNPCYVTLDSTLDVNVVNRVQIDDYPAIRVRAD